MSKYPSLAGLEAEDLSSLETLHKSGEGASFMSSAERVALLKQRPII